MVALTFREWRKSAGHAINTARDCDEYLRTHASPENVVPCIYALAIKSELPFEGHDQYVQQVSHVLDMVVDQEDTVRSTAKALCGVADRLSRPATPAALRAVSRVVAALESHLGGAHVTPAHAAFLRGCVTLRHFDMAARFYRQRCGAPFARAQCGTTPQVALEFFSYAGTALAALGDAEAAVEAYDLCCIGASEMLKGGELSKIALDATRRAVLLRVSNPRPFPYRSGRALLSMAAAQSSSAAAAAVATSAGAVSSGTGASGSTAASSSTSPSTASLRNLPEYVARISEAAADPLGFTSGAEVARGLTHQSSSGVPKRMSLLSESIRAASESIAAEGETSLVRRAVAAIRIRAVQAVAQGYATITLQQLAAMINADGGARGAESIVRGMVSRGEINARIDQATGFVEFSPEPVGTSGGHDGDDLCALVAEVSAMATAVQRLDASFVTAAGGKGRKGRRDAGGIMGMYNPASEGGDGDDADAMEIA